MGYKIICSFSFVVEVVVVLVVVIVVVNLVVVRVAEVPVFVGKLCSYRTINRFAIVSIMVTVVLAAVVAVVVLAPLMRSVHVKSVPSSLT